MIKLLPLLLALTLTGCFQGAARDTNAQPPSEGNVVATPKASCGPGSRPELGRQGRVTREEQVSGRAALGYTCNSELLGAYTTPNATGTVGGFWVQRYVDAKGQECAIYDTTLMWPTNAGDVEFGVNVLDMSDPSAPAFSTRLLTPGMLSPHESLRLNKKRGLLAAVTGNAAFYPGIVDLYDVSQDCLNPVLLSSTPIGLLGHESGMAPDGLTFYVGSAGGNTLMALDISNPALPVPLWTGNYSSHGLSISDDGTRAYVAAVGANGTSSAELIILDVSQIQARAANPQVSVVGRTSWSPISIPQNAMPFTVDGHPYLMEVDEFGAGSEVGAARIIDIGDEANPEVISNLRLEVHDPQYFDEQGDDPGTSLPIQGYAAHYCNLPSRVNPKIVACSMILSGLRVFDISNPHQPREVAYFNAPLNPRQTPGFEASSWAMSAPDFVPERKEIWYTDGYSGFFAVRLTNGAWPD